MPEKGKRRVQSKGEITLPKDFREENNIEPGDYIGYRRHSRDKSKLVIDAEMLEEGEQG